MAFVLVLAVLGDIQMYARKGVDHGEKAAPLAWLDEDTHLYARDDTIHAVNIGNTTMHLGTNRCLCGQRMFPIESASLFV